MTRFYIENFGCRATQADGAALERQFLERGLERAGVARDAEIVVLNTCTVTEAADKDARASIRRLRRVNPNCRILVTGCYAQRAPEELAAMPGVTWVVGNSHKHQAAEVVTGSFGGRDFFPIEQLVADPGFTDPLKPKAGWSGAPGGVGHLYAEATGNNGANASVVVGDIFAHTELMAAPVFEAANERTRPNLKVQDGCDNRCSFCVIPYVRGQSRSLPAERVIGEVMTLVGAGYREVVISGINLGRWGRDLSADRSSLLATREHVVRPSSFVHRNAKDKRPNIFEEQPNGASQIAYGYTGTAKDEGRTTKDGPRLVDLVRAILSETFLEKLRISSVEPMDWSDELVDLVASSPRIAKHAHVPMQSGSDAVLRRMHRKYRPWHYREKILKIREAMPQAAIGADVMVGFPGESAVEFEETRRMIEELPFTYLHVFTYSARPGTPAAQERGQVPATVARERNGVLRAIGAAKKRAFLCSLVGTEVEAITLQAGGADFTEALTENYQKVRIAGRLDANRWMRFCVEGVEGESLIARQAGPFTPNGEIPSYSGVYKAKQNIDPQPIARVP